VIFEADNRLGGRVKSREFMGYTIEECANWVEGGPANPVIKLAEEIGLQGGKTDFNTRTDYDYFDQNGNLLDYAKDVKPVVTRMWNAFYCVEDLHFRILRGEIPDMSNRDGYALCGWQPMTALEYTLDHINLEFEWGADQSDTSVLNSATWPYYSYFDPSGDSLASKFVTDQRGFSAIFDHLATKTFIPHGKNDPRIRYRHKVTQINTDTNVITYDQLGANGNVVSRANKTQCGYIINTMSIGAIQESFRLKTGLITPEWPLKKRVALFKYPMSNLRKIVLKYNMSPWGSKKAHFAIISDSMAPRTDTFLNYDHEDYYPGSNMLLVTTNAHLSQHMEAGGDKTDAWLVNYIDSQVKKAWAKGAFAGLALVGSYVTRHMDNPLLRGSYSNRPAELSNEEFNLLFEPINCRYVNSGEAACPDLNGYVPGAMFVGETHALEALRGDGYYSGLTRDNVCFRPPPGWKHPGTPPRGHDM
jgi:hypothetical protein